jgi:hypothetical protein
VVVGQAVAQAQHGGLARGQALGQRAVQGLAEDRLLGLLGRAGPEVVRDEVGQGRVALVADAGLQRDRDAGGPERLLDALAADTELLADLGRGRLTPEIALEITGDVVQLGELLDDVDRQADGPALLGDGAADSLTDPPVGVGREAETPPPVVLVDAALEADVALLDEVQE